MPEHREPTAAPLRMFGEPSDVEPLPWAWVRQQLHDAGTYWVVPHTRLGPDTLRWPHPRPVWGVLIDDVLHLSIGSPVVARQVAEEPAVTVHLESGTEVVIVEGLAIVESDEETRRCLEAYDAKYDWDYRIEQYGMLTRVEPVAVMAWRSSDWAGRGGFARTGRWIWPHE